MKRFVLVFALVCFLSVPVCAERQNYYSADNVTDLGTFSVPAGSTIHVEGVRGGDFHYDNASSATIDGGIVFDGPGSVGRFIRQLIQNTVTPEFYGALGSGADDTAEIQAVIDAVVNDGRQSRFPKSEYTIFTALTFPSGSDWALDLTGTTIKVDDSAGHVTLTGRTFIIGSTTSNFEIKNGTLDGNRVGRVLTDTELIVSLIDIRNNVKNGLFKNLNLINSMLDGVYMSADEETDITLQPTDLHFEKCKFSYCARDGVTLGVGRRISFANCIFENSTGITQKKGLNLEPDGFSPALTTWAASTAYVLGDIRRHPVDTGRYMLALNGFTSRSSFDSPEADHWEEHHQVEHVCVTDCIFRGNRGGGINGVVLARHLTVKGCTFDDNKAVEIVVVGDTTIDNCTFINKKQPKDWVVSQFYEVGDWVRESGNLYRKDFPASSNSTFTIGEWTGPVDVSADDLLKSVILVKGLDNIKIVNCNFRGMTFGDSDLVLVNTNISSIGGVEIANNRITQFYGSTGFSLRAPQCNVHHNHIEDFNTDFPFVSFSDSGIYGTASNNTFLSGNAGAIYSNVDDCSIYENHIVDVLDTGVWHPITIRAGERCRVVGNYLNDTAVSGDDWLALLATSIGTYVEGNTVLNYPTTNGGISWPSVGTGNAEVIVSPEGFGAEGLTSSDDTTPITKCANACTGRAPQAKIQLRRAYVFTQSGGLSTSLEDCQTIGEVEQTYVDADATPNVLGARMLSVTNTGSTTITDFDNGTLDQLLTVTVTDGNTTIADSATVTMREGINWPMATDSSITFRHISGVWTEVSRIDNGVILQETDPPARVVALGSLDVHILKITGDTQSVDEITIFSGTLTGHRLRVLVTSGITMISQVTGADNLYLEQDVERQGGVDDFGPGSGGGVLDLVYDTVLGGWREASRAQN